MIQKTSQSRKGRSLVDFLHSIHKEMAVVDIPKLTKLIEAWYAFEKCFVLRTFQKNGITNGRGHSRITRPSLFLLDAALPPRCTEEALHSTHLMP